MQVTITYDTDRDENSYLRAVHADEMVYVLYHIREAIYRRMNEKISAEEFLSEVYDYLDSPTIDVVLETYR